MHLIQAKRSGGQLPESTPEGLLPRQLKSADIPPITETDAKAYAGAFKKLDTNGKGMLSGNTISFVVQITNGQWLS